MNHYANRYKPNATLADDAVTPCGVIRAFPPGTLKEWDKNEDYRAQADIILAHRYDADEPSLRGRVYDVSNGHYYFEWFNGHPCHTWQYDILNYWSGWLSMEPHE